MQKVSSKTVVLMKIVSNRRKEKGIKKADMAKMLGLHIRTYQRREVGIITLDELNELCARLDLTLLIVPSELLS